MSSETSSSSSYSISNRLASISLSENLFLLAVNFLGSATLSVGSMGLIMTFGVPLIIFQLYYTEMGMILVKTIPQLVEVKPFKCNRQRYLDVVRKKSVFK